MDWGFDQIAPLVYNRAINCVPFFETACIHNEASRQRTYFLPFPFLSPFFLSAALSAPPFLVGMVALLGLSSFGFLISVVFGLVIVMLSELIDRIL